jgi:hypothetical protein
MTGLKVNLGLVMQLQLIAFDGETQVMLHA